MDKKQTENTLRDYNWMINEIKRQRELLKHAGTNLVAQSGIESTLPKAHGETGDPVAREVVRRDKKLTWIHKLEVKVSFIQERMIVIEEEREKAVLECLLDGMSMVAISRHMGLSRRHIYNLRDNIVEKISKKPNYSLPKANCS
ncbi:LuxR C-terminal-related transcriptional regulator [Halobacillus sp. Nhm2S1]|uniref:LuxR C-terminal-related transcriptional regulator n=1 Tax=Halobacillus sp. Nhm2S1 TaxID=2866716 RepID=UPI001C72FF66|nr:LuxR C-terminal-related transcriptional regulator [Halobacillus sp. Nhm2S1]MBX0358934.1 LuxR C-terminal-related transcriptional regulator [Halobacillus sp. Nhm2S1]